MFRRPTVTVRLPVYLTGRTLGCWVLLLDPVQWDEGGG